MGIIKDRATQMMMNQVMKNAEALRQDLQDIRINQREIVEGVISLYKAVEAIAKHNQIELPVPSIKMEIEK